MDKDFIERPKKFNQQEYDKIHFVQFNIKIKSELKNRIDNYCADNGISKSEFLKRAIEMLESQ